MEREAALDKAAKEIFAMHPDVPCWVPQEQRTAFTKLFAYAARLGFDAGYEASEAATRASVAGDLREIRDKGLSLNKFYEAVGEYISKLEEAK